MPSLYVTVSKDGKVLAEGWEELPDNWSSLDSDDKAETIDELEGNFIEDNLVLKSKVVANEGDK